jgi:hypothetical protein
MQRRLCCLIVGICLLPLGAAAQDGLRSASLPDRTPTNPGPASPRLPSASLPDRTATDPMPAPRSDQFLAGPDTYTTRGRRFLRPFGFGYGYAPFSYDVGQDDRQAPQGRGFLHLQVRPITAHVHVDGFYIGTVDDFRNLIPGRPLEPGPHRIELTAPGHQPVAFDVMIHPDRTVTYRRDLEATGSAAQPPSRDTQAITIRPAPAKAKTFYVIPGCYAGDKPPGNRRLPAGCDASKLRTIPPAVAVIARR